MSEFSREAIKRWRRTCHMVMALADPPVVAVHPVMPGHVGTSGAGLPALEHETAVQSATGSSLPVVAVPGESAVYQVRDVSLLRETLRRVANALWHGGRTKEHLWTIPVDQSRDWDCIFADAIDELEDLRKRVAALPPASAWQPISTAPDNVAVLVFVPNWDYYGPGIYRAIHVNFPGRSEPRWHSSAWAHGRDFSADTQPTYWQRLPAGPETP